MSDWVRTRRSLTCPVCGRGDWCTLTSDGAVVKCMRVASQDVCETGGWFHFDQPLQQQVWVPPPIPKADATELARKCYLSRHAPEWRRKLSVSLGVSVKSLEELRVGYGQDPNGNEWWSFPSRDENGRIIGVTRRYPSGAKLTYPGTSNGGVFCVNNWWSRPGVVLIVEGGSDVAAAETYGLCAVGRPSNVGGVPILREMLQDKCRGRVVMIVGENDEKPSRRGKPGYCHFDCKGCMQCFPGRVGAEHISKQLGIPYCMPPYPFKDLREAVRDLVWLDLLRKIAVYPCP